MITILLQTDAQSEPAVSETAQEPRGIMTAESTGELSARSDLDAILTEDWAAVERYGGLPPRNKAEVILDPATGERVTVYETALARYDARRVTQPTAVPWIVSLPHFAPTEHVPDAFTAMVLAPGSVPRPLRDEEVDYARFRDDGATQRSRLESPHSACGATHPHSEQEPADPLGASARAGHLPITLAGLRLWASADRVRITATGHLTNASRMPLESKHEGIPRHPAFIWGIVVCAGAGATSGRGWSSE